MNIKHILSFFLAVFSFYILHAQDENDSDSSATLVKNINNTIPIKSLDVNNIGFINLDADKSEFNTDDFLLKLNQYTRISRVENSLNESIIGEVQERDIIIAAISSKNIHWNTLYKLSSLLSKTKLILVSFLPLKEISFNNYVFNATTIIQFQSYNTINSESAAEIIFGAKTTNAVLEEDVNNNFKSGSGILLNKTIRMGYTSPSQEGLDEDFINRKVDSIMKEGIEQHAFPGAQLLVAKNNNIIYHKSFGYHTYDNIQKVSNYDLYDLASVTKVTGPLPVIMQLVDKGIIDIDEKFSTYWKPWRNVKNKKDLTFREILAHQAGLEPYYIFLNEIIKNRKFVSRFVSNTESNKYSVKIYKDLYLNKRFVKKMYRIINRTEVSEIKKYKYSGLSFLIYPEMIKQLTGINYEKYVRDSIYRPLGATNLIFNPIGKYPESLIVPTELDTIYRNAYVKGWVHDENASLLGGVSGNAGLFGTANDLAKLIKMYQNLGEYGGKRYISEKTMKEFTRVQYPENNNKRGLGFDKPLLNNATLDISHASPAPEVSAQSFGHGGFTGTYVWADPVNNLMFIFLSNRVYPTRNNRNLYNLNIRPSLQQVFYQANLN
ncbi:penicillin-binding protein, beta-lactamase class C [Galbibacter orientalis DSM 19592]|uniref:Penicillin-binding protein, beta-lactamase class C n=2 Tax=Galbibacter TaxID=379068 RepID=I3C905_9FLAO|nr:serine hydrolase [Galbibacter orientalis]EIJ40098.1 penicillin-binding protein, beta-lactamase class C [Galbibacter orientalis DSM 19592]